MSTTDRAARLAIGTAQLGLAYGVANAGGQVSVAGGAAILERGRAAGIDTIDTAVGYGESEARLGAIGVGGWKVVTKLPPVPDDAGDVGHWVRSAIAGSLERLGVPRVHGLMLHRPAQLLGPRGRDLYAALRAARDEGLAERIGYSIYEPSELDALAAFPAAIVQAPFNVVDRRLVSSGWAARLAAAGVELHVRSIFLQGLLVMSGASRPPRFSRWATLWRVWDEWLASEKLTPLEACVRFALAHESIDRVVVGVDAAGQLDEIIRAAERPMTLGAFPAALQSNDLQLINPANWNS